MGDEVEECHAQHEARYQTHGELSSSVRHVKTARKPST